MVEPSHVDSRFPKTSYAQVLAPQFIIGMLEDSLLTNAVVGLGEGDCRVAGNLQVRDAGILRPEAEVKELVDLASDREGNMFWEPVHRTAQCQQSSRRALEVAMLHSSMPRYCSMNPIALIVRSLNCLETSASWSLRRGSSTPTADSLAIHSAWQCPEAAGC